MREYQIEQYELHTCKYRVRATSEAEAIVKLYEGQGEMVDDSMEFIQTADDYGLPVDENPELVAAVQKLGLCHDDDVIPSIRSIEEI